MVSCLDTLLDRAHDQGFRVEWGKRFAARWFVTAFFPAGEPVSASGVSLDEAARELLVVLLDPEAVTA
jgi:hypothetical protein